MLYLSKENELKGGGKMRADKAMERKLRENERYVEKMIRDLERAVKRTGAKEFEFESVEVHWDIGIIGGVFADFEEGDRISTEELLKYI